MCFLGRKLIKPTVFIITFIMATFVLMLVMYSLFFRGDNEDWLNFFVMIICVLLGVVVAYLSIRYLKYGVGVMGGGAGFAIGLLICTVFHVSSTAGLWILSICLFILLFLITFKWADEVIIFGTSCLGSYLFIRGISFYAGGYPNEFVVAKYIDSGKNAEVIPW